MARIAPLEPPYTEEIASTFAKLMPPGMEPLRLFRTLAHNPRVLRRIQRGGLLDPGTISVRLRELVILRTCFLCGAGYEWGVHATVFGAAARLDAAAFDRIRRNELDDFWAEDERLVIQMCDALHANARIDDNLWAKLADRFDAPQLLELVTLAGLYHAVSFIVNATGVVAEPWAMPMLL